MVHFVESRGIRNKNPFNIRRSCKPWRGKTALNSDKDFERFTSMDYGIRAGLLLLRNGYLSKVYDTVEEIINRYAPSSDNNDTKVYIDYIIQNSPIYPGQKIFLQSLSFYHLCRCICMYESKYNLTYQHFRQVINKFGLGF